MGPSLKQLLLLILLGFIRLFGVHTQDATLSASQQLSIYQLPIRLLSHGARPSASWIKLHFLINKDFPHGGRKEHGDCLATGHRGETDKYPAARSIRSSAILEVRRLGPRLTRTFLSLTRTRQAASICLCMQEAGQGWTCRLDIAVKSLKHMARSCSITFNQSIPKL